MFLFAEFPSVLPQSISRILLWLVEVEAFSVHFDLYVEAIMLWIQAVVFVRPIFCKKKCIENLNGGTDFKIKFLFEMNES